MIVIQILGTSDASTEDQLQAMTRGLLDLCWKVRYVEGYIVFPVDRMQMDLGTEIVALVYLPDAFIPEAKDFGQEVGLILEKHFPEGTKIGVQMVEARTARALTKKS